jgi:hypothetical protein
VNQNCVHSPLKRSSTVSCSMCCPKASSKYAILASSHLAAASAWLLGAYSSSRSPQIIWGSQKTYQRQSLLPPGFAVQVVASRFISSAPFNLRGAAYHGIFRLLAPTFSLDAGFHACTQASVRLCTRKLQANRDAAAFLACVGWLFGDTIYSNEQVRRRF